MDNLAQYLAYSTPRNSTGQTAISPLAVSLANKKRTHWAELLGDLAMVGVDRWRSESNADERRSSLAEMLAGPEVMAGDESIGVPDATNPGYGQLTELLASSPELEPFFRAKALEKQYPEMFGDPQAQQGSPFEFKVWGNNAAWVNPQTQEIDWVTGGGGGGQPAPRAPGGAPAAAGPAPSVQAAPTGSVPAPAPDPAASVAPNRPLAESAAKANEFSNYMKRGGENIDSLVGAGFMPTMLTMLAEPSQDFFGMLANQVLSPEEQRFWQGVREVAAGALRRETGAAFGAGEVRDVMSRYIPLPGDSPEVIAQKREARMGVMNEMRVSSGLPAFEEAAPATAPTQAGGGKMIEPPVPAQGYPEGATYEGPEGKFVVQDGKWWQVE